MDQEVYNCFVDFKKAFDLVWHDGLWAVLRSYGISLKLITLLRNIYKDACGRSNGEWRGQRLFCNNSWEQTGWSNFSISFHHFSNGLWMLSRSWPQRESRSRERKYTIWNSLMTSICWTAHAYARLEKQVQKLDSESRRYGMQINRDKTMTMVFRRRAMGPDGKITLNGTDLKDVDSFVYLGAKLTWDNDSSEEIKRRMQLATGAFSDLKVVWRDKGIRLTTIESAATMCVRLRSPPLCCRDMDDRKSGQKTNLGIWNEMLQMDTGNQLAGAYYKWRSEEKDGKKRNGNGHHQDKKAGIVWSCC